MLWYKAWLETRWRLVFLLGSIAALILLPHFLNAPPGRWRMGFQIEAGLMCYFTGIYLAGSGINTQTLYSTTSGFHRSMLFTLSLPVTRKQLLFARASLGALETCLVIVLCGWMALHSNYAAMSLPQILNYGMHALIGTMTVYALSVFCSCFLDETWQLPCVALILSTVGLIQLRSPMVSQLSPFQGLSLVPYPIASGVPWPQLMTSLTAIVIFLSASMFVVEQREY